MIACSAFPGAPNYFLIAAYLPAIVTEIIELRIAFKATTTLPPLRLAI